MTDLTPEAIAYIREWWESGNEPREYGEIRNRLPVSIICTTQDIQQIFPIQGRGMK